MIFKVGQDLKMKYDWNLWIPEDDLKLGTELFSVLHYCNENLIEAAKLSKMFETLLANENLNTVVAATMHNIRPRAGDDIKDFTAINMWYQRLDERYNFSLASALLPLLNHKNLADLELLKPPFMEEVQKNINASSSAAIGKIRY